MRWLVPLLLLADIAAAPIDLPDLPPEIAYLKQYVHIGDVVCTDLGGSRRGICKVVVDEATRDHYFLFIRHEHLKKVWRVDGLGRRPELIWEAPPRCDDGDLCAQAPNAPRSDSHRTAFLFLRTRWTGVAPTQ